MSRKNAFLPSCKLYFFLLLFIVLGGQSYAQLTIDFRVVSVASDVDDMDPAGGGFNGLDSDPRWVYEVVDVPFGTAMGGEHMLTNVNCPGSLVWVDTFFSQTYPAGCNTPTDYTLNLSAADADVNPATPLTLGDALANGTFNIPALSLAYPSLGWQPLGTFNLTAGGIDCGSTGTVTWTFVIEYQTVGQTEYVPPAISCLPGTITQNVDPGTCGAVVNGISPVSLTDNCGVAAQTWSFSGTTTGTSPTTGINDASGNIFNTGSTTVTYTATDYSSNAASCNFIINIIDNELPAISCPSDTTLSATPGLCTAVVNGLDPVVTDNCLLALQTWSMAGVTAGTSPGSGVNSVSGQVFNSGTTTVTYYVEDPGGNAVGCAFDVIVLDTVAPSITCPANISQNVSGVSCEAVVSYATPVGTDNCPLPSTVMLTGVVSGGLFPGGVTTVTYQVTDAGSNSSQCSFDVTVLDNINPNIVCPSNITQNNDIGSCGAIINYTVPVGTDNCASPTTSLIAGQVTGTLFPVGTTAVTYLVADLSGNTNQCSFNVTISDAENPTITCPADVFLNNDPGICGASCTYAAPVGNDNCPGAITSMISGFPSGAVLPIGITTMTFEVEDLSSNAAQCSFDVTVTDNEVPVISCPADIIANNAPGICGAIASYVTPLGTDNCPGATTTLATGQTSGTVFPVGTTTVTYEALDNSGNLSQCTFDVTINDVEIPVVSCPVDITTINNPGLCNAVVNYGTPVGTDNCPGVLTNLTAGLMSGSGFPVGTTTVVFGATDVSGNVGTCNFNVTVNDIESPVITCPGNISVNNDPGVCGAGVIYGFPTSADNCGILSTAIVSGPLSGAVFNIGTTQVTFETIDINGNAAQCSFDVTVLDSESPTITCPADVSVSNDPGVCSAIVTYSPPVINDNCPGSFFNITAGMLSGVAYPLGTTTNTYEVVDAGGNIAQCSFDVTVTDTEAPGIVCPPNIVASNDPALCEAIVAYGIPVFTDNCGGATVNLISGLASGSPFPVGTTTNTFQVTDATGNTNQCSFDVAINDAENPVVSCPANISVNNDPGTCGATVAYGAAVGIDNCPGAVTALVSGSPSGSVFQAGVTVVTYQTTDAAGNTAQCYFNITVVDIEIPTVTCPPNMLLYNDLGVCGAIVNYGNPVVIDNCPFGSGSVTILTGFPAGNQFPVGTTLVTLEFTDVSGNSGQCSFNVTVNDTEPPIAACPVDQIITANAQCQFSLADYSAMFTVTDNCGSFTVIQSPAPGTIVSASQAVYCFATDQYGNTDWCSFNAIANDITPPVLVCPTSDTVYMSLLCDYTVDSLINFITVTENCNNYTYTQTPVVGNVLYADTLATITVTDGAGNLSTCSFNLVVTDSTPPIVTCPVDYDVFFSSVCDFVIQDYSGAISTWDNCGFASLLQDPLPGFAITGPTAVIMTGTDINGNVQQCLFNVIPLDTVPPSLVCPSDQIGYLNDSCAFLLPDYTPLGVVVSTCEIIPLSQSPPPGTLITANTTIALSGYDYSGNFNACTFNVILDDIVPPVITCPPDISSCDSVVFYPVPGATDNCNVANVTRISGPASGTIFPAGATTIIYEATDDYGNIDTCSFVVTVLPFPELSAQVNDISCYGLSDGSIDINLTGGSSPFVFNWSNGASSEDLSGLVEGTYYLVVTDKFGCVDTLTDSILMPPVLTTDYNISPVGCSGTTDGYISLVNVQGGTFPYNFIWDPPVGTGTNSDNLTPGTYSVSIVDGNGCSADTTITITNSEPMVVSGTISMYDNGFNLSEENGFDGWIDLTVSGGTTPYTCYWDSGQGESDIFGLAQGYYNVTVIDEGGCQGYAGFYLEAPINIIVGNGLSPNGDGINDVFYIENIERFPNSQLLIMNRWGDIVYEISGYQNDWDGTPNKGLIMYGNKVPEGSYFYSLDPGQEPYQKMSGYLIVNGY